MPLIITGPGVPRGVIRREFVSLIDLFPTFLDMARVTAFPDVGLQGYSLAPMINLTTSRTTAESATTRPPHVAVEFAGDCTNAPKFMLRSGDMKLIQVHHFDACSCQTSVVSIFLECDLILCAKLCAVRLHAIIIR